MAPSSSRLSVIEEEESPLARREDQSPRNERTRRRRYSYPFTDEICGDESTRVWLRNLTRSLRFEKRTLLQFADAALDTIIEGTVKMLSTALDLLPAWFKEWFHLEITEVFSNRSLRSTLPLFVVGTIIGILYTGFVNVYLPASGLTMTSGISILFHSLMLLAVTSYYKGVVVDPGQIPESWTSLPHVASMLVEKKRKTGAFRWCQKEEKYKPDRAHFCTPMGRNILRMDHYCPWLVNCVGFHNHKYFFLFLLYTTLATNLVGYSIGKMFLTTWVTAGNAFFGWEVECMTGVLSVCITPFFLFHCWLISKNMTTIEFCETRRGQQGYESPYDINLYVNLKTVLGTNPFLWLLPVASKPICDGMVFEINEEYEATEREPEETGTKLRNTCWDELWVDFTGACCDVHVVTADAALRFRNLFWGAPKGETVLAPSSPQIGGT